VTEPNFRDFKKRSQGSRSPGVVGVEEVVVEFGGLAEEFGKFIHLPYWSSSSSQPPKFFCAVQHSGYEGGCTTQLHPTSSTAAAGNDGAAWCVTPP